mgnify:CR=1 FL=1
MTAATIDNNEYQLYSNVAPNHLHGGKVGFNKKIWKIENIEEQTDSIKCIMKYLSQDMEENYPGNLDCTVTYELNNNNESNDENDANARRRASNE